MMLLSGCDSVRNYGSKLVGAIPIVGPILEPFVGEWLAEGEDALQVIAKTDIEAMVKQYIDDKLAFVAPHATVDSTGALTMEFSRKDGGKVRAKLDKHGKFEVAYPDTTVTMELERK